jgi:hypothetical protein
MSVAERGQDFCSDIGTSFSRRERAVSGKVVEGKGDEGVSGGGRMRGRIGGRSLSVGDGGREEERSNCKRTLKQTR